MSGVSERRSVEMPVSSNDVIVPATKFRNRILDAISMLSSVSSHGLVYYACELILEWQQDVRRKYIKDSYVFASLEY